MALATRGGGGSETVIQSAMRRPESSGGTRRPLCAGRLKHSDEDSDEDVVLALDVELGKGGVLALPGSKAGGSDDSGPE